IKPLQQAQNKCLRWLLGAFRTTPIDAAHHLASIMPIRWQLHKICDRVAIRLHTLPANSQVLARLPHPWPLTTHRQTKRSGAGACILLAGHSLLEKSWGLGRQSEVYDAEMFALAAAATNVAALLPDHPDVTHIVFASDNRAAVESALDLRP
ncbi:uncharacterized protein LAESUDRAFT_629098, partial [Laetiporus sulphureus 93-53]